MIDFEARRKAKMHSEDRILVIQTIEGRKPLSGTGLVNMRLFEDGKNLHAILSPVNSLWYLRYTHGVLPEPLKQQFTSFTRLIEYVKIYLEKRGMRVVEVIDV